MSALGNKGEKNQGKFKAIDINNLFKGTSVTPQKPAPARSGQHGLQSLGKVASIRRMPPPANLPSLRSENSGSDSNLALTDRTTGWTKEDSPPESPSAAAPAAPAPQQQKPLQPPQPPTTVTAQPVQDLHHSQPVAIVAQGHGPLPANANPLWSNIMFGDRRPGSFLDQKSVMFCEEFPQLAQGSDEKTPTGRREDESRDGQHGPGLNLRPQS
jgi:hypothetical protein